jgi:hypothetical protein
VRVVDVLPGRDAADRGSANGIATRRATSYAQIVSESTSATSGVDAASQPSLSAGRLPGTSVTMTVTG